MAKEVNPRLVFERLFASHGRRGRPPTGRSASATTQSILDFVREDAQQLQGRLGANDRRKLDEYLTAVREIEQRIARRRDVPRPTAPNGMPAPTGVPDGLSRSTSG